MNKRSLAGIFLLLLGILLLLNRGELFSAGTIIGHFWPSLFVIPTGVFLHWLYFTMTGRKGVGLLIPGGIVFTSGIVCQIAMLFDNWDMMWPGFLLAVAVGLFEFYWFGPRNKWLLVPIAILSALSVLFFTVFSVGSLLNQVVLGQPILAVVLIAVGGLLLFSRKKAY